jgi:hypothetical protein
MFGSRQIELLKNALMNSSIHQAFLAILLVSE